MITYQSIDCPIKTQQIHSCYGVPSEKGNLIIGSQNLPQAENAKTLHRRLIKVIESQHYPCVGAKSVFHNSTYRFGYYPLLGSDEATAGLSYDLYKFLHEMSNVNNQFVSFIAAFSDQTIYKESIFEKLLWKQLCELHQIDEHPWDQTVSANPQNANFSFSFGGHAFFVIGLHPNSSRLARQFEQPLLIFNLHRQFENLRESGKYDKMKQVIRARDLALQGSVNPMMTDFGSTTEARQYSGRAVETGWQCPYQFSNNNNVAKNE